MLIHVYLSLHQQVLLYKQRQQKWDILPCWGAECTSEAWAFVKRHVWIKGERKGHKQSFKRTLNSSGQLVSTSGSHSRVNKCLFNLTAHTEPHWTGSSQHPTDWTFKTKKYQVPGPHFVLFATIPLLAIYMLILPFLNCLKLSLLQATGSIISFSEPESSCSFTFYHIILTMWQKIPFL